MLVKAGPALACGSFEEKRPIVNKDEPRMNTNKHEDRWAYSNDKWNQNASAIVLLWYRFVSFVENLLPIGCHSPQPRIHQPINWCSFVSIRGSSFPSMDIFCWSFVVIPSIVSGKSGLRPPRRGGSFESETGFVSDKSSPRPTGRIIREQNNQKSIIPSRPWHPVAVNLNALVALRRSSWPFVDNSFFFCFRRGGSAISIESIRRLVHEGD